MGASLHGRDDKDTRRMRRIESSFPTLKKDGEVIKSESRNTGRIDRNEIKGGTNMYKTKYMLIVAVAVLGLALWGGRSFAQSNAWVEGQVGGGFPEGGYPVRIDTFDVSYLIGYRVYSPEYIGDLGQITDVLIDRCDGRAAFVVLSDTPGFGSEYAFVPFGALERTGEHTFQVLFRGADVPVNPRDLDFKGDRFAQYMAINRGTIGMRTVPATIDPAWAANVYKFYGVTPFWSASQPEIASYRMSGRTEDFAIRYPDGAVVAFSGAAPYWTSCGGSCGSEAMNFAGLAEPSMPSDARPGECYARVFVAPRCETVTEQVMTRAASEKVETIPAKYETVEERVMVQPASKRMEEVPAEYKTVDEQVLVEPARTEWRPGRGAVEKMDPATGKVMCLVEIPAKYKTVSKQVLVKEATTREVEIPAQYEMRSAQKMIEPAQERHIQIPAEYKSITKTEKVADGYFEWRKVEGCHAE